LSCSAGQLLLRITSLDQRYQMPPRALEWWDRRAHLALWERQWCVAPVERAFPLERQSVPPAELQLFR